MRRPSFRPPAVALAVAAGALASAACSDSVITAPTHTPGVVSRSATLNGNSFTIASDAGSQFCSAQAVLGVFATFPASFAPITSGCTAAEDLQTDGSLAAYNPGWEQLTGGDWIGFTTNGGPSSDYRPTPGIYVFQQTFVLPTGVTSPSVSLNVRADNVVAVYLNGHLLGQQAMVDCNDGAFGPCHWTAGGTLTVSDNTAADFNANPAVNYLTFLVNDVPTGYPDLVAPPAGKGGPAPQYGCTTRAPQLTGSHLFTGDGAVTTVPAHAGPLPTGNAMSPTPTPGTPNPGQVGCENPTGLAFAGSVTWTVPPPPICDFITFGRLVLQVGDDKIVISGNAGGNAPGGGILGTIEISVGGTQYHVPTIESYGLPTSGVLFGDPFARVITGHSGTDLIELRLRDNPNPGQGEPGTDEGDKVWLKINNTVVVPLQTLDKGNIQLHLNCRGPGD